MGTSSVAVDIFIIGDKATVSQIIIDDFILNKCLKSHFPIRKACVKGRIRVISFSLDSDWVLSTRITWISIGQINFSNDIPEWGNK